MFDNIGIIIYLYLIRCLYRKWLEGKSYRFATQIHQVDLTWGNIRIDSLTPSLGVMAASFHEIQIGEKGIQSSPSGYFTGVVESTLAGWKLRDAHWSIAKPDK